MSSSPDEGPRCVHHPNLAAAVECSGCGNFLCRLCVHVENGLDTCRDCHAACNTLAANSDADDSYYAAVEFSQAPKPKPKNASKSSVTKATSSANSAAVPVPPVPPASLAHPEGQRLPKPLAHQKLPPFYCKNHPNDMATRQCRHCSEEFCSACANMVEGNPRCPDCGGQINALMPEDQGLPPRGIFQNVTDALIFPFRGTGLLMLIFGSVLVFFCSFDWKSLLFSYAFMYTFGIKICNTSALGRETPPDWPGFGDIGNAISYFIAWLVSQLPAFAYLVLIAGVGLTSYVTGSTDDDASPGDASAMMSAAPEEPLGNHEESQKDKADREDRIAKAQSAAEHKLKAARERLARKLIPFYILSLLGNLYLPMAVLALILYRNYTVLNPLFIAESALKAGKGYVGAVLTFIAADIFRMIPGLCREWMGDIGMLIVPMIAAPLFLYLLMVSMRALGIMYYFNQRRLAWFT